MSVNPNYYRLGGYEGAPELTPIIDELKNASLWESTTEFDSLKGSAPAATERTNILTDVGSTYSEMPIRDIWADLGDGIKHKVLAVHSDIKVEFENYFDNVPGTINLTFWVPRRVTLKLEGDSYIESINFLNAPMCLTIIGDGGATLTNTDEDFKDTFGIPTFSITDPATSGDASNIKYGSLTIEDIRIDNRNQGVGVFEGTVYTKAYDDSDPNHVVGRLDVLFVDCVIESVSKSDGVSIWHSGTHIEMCCIITGPEQAIEHISSEKAISMNTLAIATKDIGVGHYQAANLVAVRWERSADDNYKNGCIVIGSYMECANNSNDTFETTSAMGTIGLILANSEIDGATDPTINLITIGNLYSIDVPVSGYGQALRLVNYNVAGSLNMKISSYFDSFIVKGDITNYHDAYGDRGVVDMYYPYKTPTLGSANGGSSSVIKT